MKYRHYRDEFPEYNNFGGVTIAWNDRSAGVSICSMDDQFCKKIGRDYANVRNAISKVKLITHVNKFVVCVPSKKFRKREQWLREMLNDAIRFLEEEAGEKEVVIVKYSRESSKRNNAGDRGSKFVEWLKDTWAAWIY
jgi:hypothetical protein